MSGKRLLPLIVVLGILVVAAIVLKRQPTPIRLVEEVGFTRLVPQSLLTDEIRGIDLYQGAKTQNVLRLRRRNRAWVVASHFDAPVQTVKIERLLASLIDLQGELRSDKAELLKAFHLESSQALHLRIYTQDPDKPAVHLLAGKRQGNNGFIRVEDDARIYSVNLNLFNEADLQNDKTSQSPPPEPWLDLQIQNVPESQLTAFELHMPHRHWKFERKFPAPSPDASSSSIQKTQPHWMLASPAVDYPLHERFVDGLITTLRTLRADDVTDPAKANDYGLLDTPYRAIITVKAEGKEIRQQTVWIGNEVPQHQGKRYARLGKEGPVYILPQWTFPRLFPKSKELLDLPSLQVPQSEIRQIALFSPTSTVLLRRDEPPAALADTSTTSPWSLLHPPTGFSLRKGGVDDWVQQLATFVPDDLAPDGIAVQPVTQETLPRIEVLFDDDSRHVIRLGSVLDSTPQQYALFMDGHTTPFAIDQQTREQIFPAVKTLLDLRLVDSEAKEIVRLTWQIGEQTRHLERQIDLPKSDAQGQEQPTNWHLVEAPQAKADSEAVQSLLNMTAHLTAEDWLEHDSSQTDPVNPALVLTLSLRDDRKVQLSLSKQRDEYLVRRHDLPGVFVISETTYAALRNKLDTLFPSKPSSPTATPAHP